MGVSLTESVIATGGISIGDSVGSGNGVTDNGSDGSESIVFSFLLGTLPSVSSLTRDSNAYVANSAGIYVEASTNVARFNYDLETLSAEGLIIETTCTNLVTIHRDLSQPQWRATNIDATEAVGIDGVVGAATLLQAVSAANGTIVSDVSGLTVGDDYTLSAHIIGEYITDRIDLTINDGSNTTQTEITGDIYASEHFQHVYVTFIATTTQYEIGLRMVGVGDFIRVDCIQVEAGGHPTSPIIDSGVVREPEILTFTLNEKTWNFVWPEASKLFEARKLQTIQFVPTGVIDTYDAYITFLFEATQTTITHVIEDVEFT